jgi:hypothetical protein
MKTWTVADYEFAWASRQDEARYEEMKAMEQQAFKNDFKKMRACVRSEWENPHSKSFGPDSQAAINAYLQRGGTNGEDLEELFRQACEAEGLDY